MALISVTEASADYPLSTKHIRYLLAHGTLMGRKIGNSWALEERSLKAYLAKERKRGPRPKRKSRRNT